MGGIVTGFFGASAPSAPNLTTYQPQYTSQADTSAFSGINQISSNNPYLQNQQAYQTAMNAGVNSPYAAGAQTSANTAGQQLASLGTTGMTSSNALNASAMGLLPYVSQVENLSMDPQGALYNQQAQQAADQANATNAAYGITGPYAAATANQANQNFNLGWQNNLLSRATTGLGAAGTAIGSAANGLSSAQNIGSNAAANTVLSGSTPNAAYYGNLANQINALNSYGQSQTNANANTQTATQDYLNYMIQGENQANQQAQLNQDMFNDQMESTSAQNSQLSGLVNGLTGLLSPSSTGTALNSILNPSTASGTSSVINSLMTLFS